MTIFQSIKELRHNGRPVDAWNIGYPELQKDPENLFLKRSLYWACYDGIKVIQERIVKRKNTTPSQQEQQDIASWISCIEMLNLPLPCEEMNFRFFNLFKDNGEHYGAYVNFVLQNYQQLFLWPDDFTPFQGEQHESASQVVKQARIVAKGWLIYRKEWGINLSVLLPFLDMVDEKAKDHDKIWLHYDYAKCLISVRNYDSAREIVLPIVRTKASEFWAWGALAATYIESNPNKAVACFAKGISACREAKLSVKMIGSLATLLSRQGNFDIASTLLCSLADIYSSEGWPLKPEYEQLMAQPWFDASVAETVDLEKFFRKAGEQANSFLYDEVATISGLVSSIHLSGKGFNVYCSPNLKIPVKKSIYAEKRLPAVGDWVSVTYGKTSGQVEALKVVSTSPAKLSGVEVEVGELRINPKGFAFVGDTFVAPYLVVQELNGAQVEVLKIWDMNTNKEEMAWKAIQVKKLVS